MAAKTFPVVETFGPTVQGEGPDQGLPCLFVRFGGCDYSCSWCDTPHAVLPKEVRKAERLTAEQIVAELWMLHAPPYYVVVSGGNPALHDLEELVTTLRNLGYQVAVETQGTKHRPWMSHCERICVSPKPPSSGMVTDFKKLDNFVATLFGSTDYLKVVVFDEADLEYAVAVHERYPHMQFYVSAGNDAGRTVGHPDREDPRTLDSVRRDLLTQSLWLTEQVLADPRLADVRVQSQYHVLLWGNVQGV